MAANFVASSWSVWGVNSGFIFSATRIGQQVSHQSMPYDHLVAFANTTHKMPLGTTILPIPPYLPAPFHPTLPPLTPILPTAAGMLHSPAAVLASTASRLATLANTLTSPTIMLATLAATLVSSAAIVVSSAASFAAGAAIVVRCAGFVRACAFVFFSISLIFCLPS